MVYARNRSNGIHVLSANQMRVPRHAYEVNIDEQNEEFVMNWDRIEGNWKQLKGKAKEQWGKLTDDELDVIAGKRDQFVGKVQERYGIAKDEAERQVDDFARRNDM